jgi:hypothetical protein
MQVERQITIVRHTQTQTQKTHRKTDQHEITSYPEAFNTKKQGQRMMNEKAPVNPRSRGISMLSCDE